MVIYVFCNDNDNVKCDNVIIIMTFFFSNLHFGGPLQVLGPPTGTGAPTRYWGPYALCVLCVWGVAALHVTYIFPKYRPIPICSKKHPLAIFLGKWEMLRTRVRGNPASWD